MSEQKVFFVGGSKHGTSDSMQADLPKAWQVHSDDNKSVETYILHTVQRGARNFRVYISQSKELGGLIDADFRHLA